MNKPIFSRFPSEGTLHFAVSNQTDGSIKKETGEINHAKLLHFFTKEKFKGFAISMHQVHSATVSVVENNRELVIQNTDCLLTKNPHLALAVLTADCLPIFLYDPQHQAVGALHAGRKGLVKGIIEKAVSRMQKEYDTKPQNLLVAIGPHIRTKCYEVGEAIAGEFCAKFKHAPESVIIKDTKYFLSLRAAALFAFLHTGVTIDHIEVSSICTKCDETYFSYRRGDTNGRFVSLISL